MRITDFGRGRSADLAVGTPGERVDGDLYAGAVNVLHGSSRGVTNADQLWSRDSRGIKGSAEEYDGFGVMRG